MKKRFETLGIYYQPRTLKSNNQSLLSALMKVAK